MKKAFNTDINGDGYPTCEGKNYLYIIKTNGQNR
jgi:hypothetical protein